MMLRIGEFARRGRVSVKALRHYEAIGLLRPTHTDTATGYRYYKPAQLDTLNRLICIRALGLSLERIRPFLQDGPCRTCCAVWPNITRRWHAGWMPSRRSSPPSNRASASSRPGRRPTRWWCPTCRPACVASIRRVVPEYGALNSLFDEIARALPATARVTGHGAVWHHCAPHKREIDCEAIVLWTVRRTTQPGSRSISCRPAARPARPSQ